MKTGSNHKRAILARKLAEAKKVERASLFYLDNGMTVIGNDLWNKARALFAEANKYSLRWDVV